MGYTLNNIVKEFLILTGRTETQTARFQQIGLDVLRTFHLDTTGLPVITELEIQPNDTAELPCGFVGLSRIALCAPDGALYALSVNNDLCINKNYDKCGNIISNSPQTFFNAQTAVIVPFLADNMRNGEVMGRMYGIGGNAGQFGEYRIDLASNRIVFRGLLQTSSIVMEYICDLNSTDNNFMVHPYCLEALKDGMNWGYKKWSSKPLGEQQLAKADYDKSFRNMQIRFMSSNIQSWVDAFMVTNIRTPAGKL